MAFIFVSILYRLNSFSLLAAKISGQKLKFMKKLDRAKLCRKCFLSLTSFWPANKFLRLREMRTTATTCSNREKATERERESREGLIGKNGGEGDEDVTDVEAQSHNDMDPKVVRTSKVRRS